MVTPNSDDERTQIGREPRLPVAADVAFRARFNADARGSQTVLLAFIIGGFTLFIVAAVLVAMVPSASAMGWFTAIAGSLALFAGCVMWHKSQSDSDRSLMPQAHPSAITVKRGGDEVTISGDAQHVHSQDSKDLALEIISRRLHRRALPHANGRITGSASDPSSIQQFTVEEGEADSVELIRKVGESNVVDEKILSIIKHNIHKEEQSVAISGPRVIEINTNHPREKGDD